MSEHEELVKDERALAAHGQPRRAVVEGAQHDQQRMDRVQLRPQPEGRRRAAEKDGELRGVDPVAGVRVELRPLLCEVDELLRVDRVVIGVFGEVLEEHLARVWARFRVRVGLGIGLGLGLRLALGLGLGLGVGVGLGVGIGFGCCSRSTATTALSSRK